jgi:hypothetical protein
LTTPHHIRSDNGPEFTAGAIREWLGKVGAKTLYIEPGSPWENGYVESFNGKLRDELLDREISYISQEVQVLTESYRQTYNRIRPHSALGYRPPAPQVVLATGMVPALVGLTLRVVQRWGQFSQGAGFGYSVGRCIAYGYLPAEYAVEGKKVEIQYFGQRYEAPVAREPLYDSETARLKS